MKAVVKKAGPKTGQHESWLSASGLDDWAAWERTSPEVALAIASSLLAGTAGGGWLLLPDGPLKLPKLDLIIADPCSREARVVVKLAGAVELLNQRLIDNMAGYSPAVLNQLDLGAAEGPTNRNPASASALARHRKALLPEIDCDDLLGADLEVDERQARREAITRPAFLLGCPRPGEMRTLVSECHRSMALAPGLVFPVTRYPAHTIRTGIEIAELLDGRLCRSREDTRVSSPCQLRLHAVFTPAPDAFARLPELAPLLLDRCLVVEAPEPKPSPGVQMAGRHEFAEAYRATVASVLNTRRQGHDTTFQFTSAEASALLETGLRDYDQECDLLAAEPGPSARGLPASLCWAMGMLARHSPRCQGLDEQVLVRSAFTVARRLLARHAARSRNLRAAEVVAEQMKLAARIAAEVRARGPLSQRDLARSFHSQQMSRFNPVIAALVAAGVIAREGKWSLAPGTVVFEKVRQDLEKQFTDAETGDQEDGQGVETTTVEKGKARKESKSERILLTPLTAFEDKTAQPRRKKTTKPTTTSDIKST